MLQKIPWLQPDPILSLMEAFREDPRPEKIDLSVGVFRTDDGTTPVLRAVKLAEQQLVFTEDSKCYIAPAGDVGFLAHMRDLVLGHELGRAVAGRVASVQTPGGCGALYVLATLVHRALPGAVVHLPDPTWPNHAHLLTSAGLHTHEYPYLDRATHDLRFGDMAEYLSRLGPNDVVLLHGCCHNPCGVDLELDHWTQVLELARSRGFVPLVDLAYQGFAEGLDADAAGVRKLAAGLPELLVAVSCSKSFALYRERTGAALALSPDAPQAAAAGSQLESIARACYSMPPAHGAALVRMILDDPALEAEWRSELAGMQQRIRAMRARLVSGFTARGAGERFAFIDRQHGMFSCLGIEPAQVQRLREEYAIYMVGSSRINVAGARASDAERVCESVLAVL